jgi:hypothetical protein
MEGMIDGYTDEWMMGEVDGKRWVDGRTENNTTVFPS